MYGTILKLGFSSLRVMCYRSGRHLGTHSSDPRQTSDCSGLNELLLGGNLEDAEGGPDDGGKVCDVPEGSLRVL